MAPKRKCGLGHRAGLPEPKRRKEGAGPFEVLPRKPEAGDALGVDVGQDGRGCMLGALKGAPWRMNANRPTCHCWGTRGTYESSCPLTVE